ncbi:uncharacterized protein TNCV_2315791 [Trichonephila clavipes]|nr:uncharacterized protein TNCV_2315791 [Trichonephila clavipes]
MGFHYWYDDTMNYSLEKLALGAGFELLRNFGLVRWGLGESGHVEGTAEKLSFASKAARCTGARDSLTNMSWLLYQLVYNPAYLLVPGGAWMGSCIAERGALPRPLLVAESRASPAKLVLRKSKGILLLLYKKNSKYQNKEKIQNAYFKTPNPPYPTHLTQPMSIEQISLNTRFLLIALPNNEMVSKSHFVIQKALIGIGGETKSVKRLRSGDMLIETTSALQTKNFLFAKYFLNSPVTVSPHKSLNSCRGVISEPYLLGTSDPENLEGFSDQDVTQIRRITIKKDSTIVPTKHLILSFNNPNLPNTIKAGYLNCKIRPYIPNPLRCFKCQSTSSSVSTFSTSSSSTQENLLPSPSGILPTIQSESLLQIPIPTTTTTPSPGNILNTLVSPLETETHSPTTPVKLTSVSTENLSASVHNECNSEHSTAAEAQQFVKRKSRNRRKRPKVQKPDIEIKRVPHRSRNATPT